MPRIILASNSPRRRELLAGLDLEFTVDTRNDFEEIVRPGTKAHDVPIQMAVGKSHGFHRMLEDDEVLLTADTVVIAPGSESEAPVVLGKPRDREDAVRMLRMLSGRTHEVVTAVVVRTRKREEHIIDIAKVEFMPVDDESMAYYIDKYKPYDKAGSYGIQEWIGYAFISRIEGSFYTVMGFPVHKVREVLSRID